MGSQTLDILSAGHHFTTTRSAGHPDDALWLSSKDLEQATGWNLKPEGLCRDEICVPLAPSDRDRLVRDDAVCVSGLWETLGRPALHDRSHSVWIATAAQTTKNFPSAMRTSLAKG